MKTTTLFTALVISLALLLPPEASAKRKRTCPINNSTDMVYYSGSGASSISQSWMTHFLDWWRAQGADFSYVDLSAAEVGACDLTAYPDLDVYIQPGGDAYLAQKWIGADGKSRIQDFLASGGAYFGACAGWYFAAGDYVWQDNYYDHSNLLGVYPVAVEGSIREIADYDVGAGYTITTLENGLQAVYWGGPTIGYEYTGELAGEVIEQFTYRSLPAVVRYQNMLLTSVHLEAFENDNVSGLSTEAREANYRYLARLINETAGTSFFVPDDPEPPGPSQCADGMDNDGDGHIDMADPDCANPEDDDESAAPPEPSDVLFDTFETGLDWALSGPGAPWEIRTDQVWDGQFSAGIKRTGANKPSIMEHAIDLGGYNSATLAYHRKLSGLDASDDFRAEYFDGQWVAVEAIGSGRANGGFAERSFAIPVTATAIRFVCEAGAVSEGCWVDNVRVSAQ